MKRTQNLASPEPVSVSSSGQRCCSVFTDNTKRYNVVQLTGRKKNVLDMNSDLIKTMLAGERNGRKIFDPKKISLDVWIEIIKDPNRQKKYYFEDYRFPNDAIHDGYIATASERTEEDITHVLKCFLLPAGNLDHDKSMLDSHLASGDLLNLANKFEFYKRLANPFICTWEGMTWIMDLLPAWPEKAITAINSYILAHVQQLPDGRLIGLYDCIDLITARYLEKEDPRDLLLAISDREFEFVTAQLYTSMKYDTKVTPKSADGGFDVLAIRSIGKIDEHVLIECKQNTDKPVGVGVVRQLLGVVNTRNATRGVIVTTNRFTAPAIEFANECRRIELVDYKILNGLMNRFIGPLWPSSLMRIITTEERKDAMEDRR